MTDRYIPLGPGENARYLRNFKILNQAPTLNQILQFDGNYWAPVSAGGATGVGDVVGPTLVSDNAVPRFNLTTGKLLQDSNVLVDDAGNMSGVVDLSINSLQTSAGVTINAAGYLTGLTSLTTTTLVVTDVITTGDNMIVLNDEVVGAPSEDAGIEINRGTSTDARLMWNEPNARWEAGLSGNLSNIIRVSDLSGITHNTFSGRDTAASHPASAISINNTSLGGSATEVQTLLEDIYASNSIAKWNADSLQGTSINSITLNSAFDGYVLTYNSADTEWVAKAASGGGTDLTGTQVDNTITVGNGTDTVQSPDTTILVPQNMSMTGAIPNISPASAATAVSLTIEGGTSSDNSTVGGDLDLKGGQSTKAGVFSAVKIYGQIGGTGQSLQARFQNNKLYFGSDIAAACVGTRDSGLGIGYNNTLTFMAGASQIITYTDIAAYTDGGSELGKRSGLMRRYVNGYFKTSVVVGGETNEVGNINIGNGTGINTSAYKVGGTQVVGMQQNHIANCTEDIASVNTTVNSILIALRNHGLLASF